MASLENTGRSSKLGPDFPHGNNQLVLNRRRFFSVEHLGMGSSLCYSHYPPLPSPPSITLIVFIVLLDDHGFLGMKENRTISTPPLYFKAKKKKAYLLKQGYTFLGLKRRLH